MKKRNRIIYWIATLWLSLGMVSTGLAQLFKQDKQVEMFNHLGYPVYFLTLIGVWKIAGTVAVLIPKFPLIKEWAYAGFFFTMSGAIISHIICRDAVIDIFGPCLLIILCFISWYLRPDNRKPLKSPSHDFNERKRAITQHA